MSKRWRNAGPDPRHVRGRRLVREWLVALVAQRRAIVLRAGFNAATVFVGVWLYDGIYHVALWVTRLIARMASPRPDRQDESEPRPRA